MFGFLGVILFGITLTVSEICVVLAMKFLECLPLSKAEFSAYCYMLQRIGFNAPLYFLPWIRIKNCSEARLDMGEFSKEAQKQGRPTFFIANHTSFFDIMSAVSLIPPKTRPRMYIGSFLLSYPLLGTALRCMDLFPVHFVGKGEENFGVDQEKMKKVNERVEIFLKGCGTMCFFPEGKVNSNPEQILPLRFGGVKMLLDHDGCIVLGVFHGNHVIWPKKAPVGGYPGTVNRSTKVLAPNGAKALLEEYKELKEQEDEGKSDVEVLERHIRRAMQSEFDRLAAIPASSFWTFYMFLACILPFMGYIIIKATHPNSDA